MLYKRKLILKLTPSSSQKPTKGEDDLSSQCLACLLLGHWRNPSTHCPFIPSSRVKHCTNSESVLQVCDVVSLQYTGCPGGNVPDFGRMFLTLKYTDITQNTYIRSWTVTEIMARETCGLLVVPRTVPVSRVVTRTLRMSVLQSHSQVKHIPT